MLHIYAALAEKERQLISDRTIAGLAAAKAKGKKLGNPTLKAKPGTTLGRKQPGAGGAAGPGYRAGAAGVVAPVPAEGRR